ncbi:hypothetical protein HDU86_005358 [Geranomyces michiganensis]|nr:hypothetical protein HDU86_005358 [Geranomyces michiganensis]
MQLDTSPATLCSSYPHSAEWHAQRQQQQQQHQQQHYYSQQQQQLFGQDTTITQPFPPAQFDHRALQAQLELHLQQLSPDGSTSSSSHDPRIAKPPHLYYQQQMDQQQQYHMQDVYDFQDVHRRLLACGGASPGDTMMLVNESSPTTTSSGVGPTSPASSDMMCMSPPPQRGGGGAGGGGVDGTGKSTAPVFTPMPSPQRGGQRGLQVTMGFRKDCEKCRQGVPGHYMHLMNR